MKKEEIILSTVYKEFYGKDLVFVKENKKNITIEIQAMVYLLHHYGVNLGDYRFAYNVLKDLKMPTSIELQDVIVNMFLYYENDYVKDVVELDDKARIMINSIGNVINDAIKNSEEASEDLRLISSIHYTDVYIIPSSSVIDIANFNNCSTDEVAYVKQLVQSIKTD